MGLKQARCIRVQESLSVSTERGVLIGPPKSERGRRSVPLLDDHVAILRQHRSLVAAIRLSAQHWDESSDAVFPSTVGTWQRPSNVQRRFRRLRDRLEWEGNILSLIHISEPTRLRRISYAVFCLKKKKIK